MCEKKRSGEIEFSLQQCKNQHYLWFQNTLAHYASEGPGAALHGFTTPSSAETKSESVHLLSRRTCDSGAQRVNTFLTKSMYLSYLLCINKLLVCHLLPAAQSMYLSYLLCINKLLVCHLLPAAQSMYLSYLLCINKLLVCHLLPAAQSTETLTTKSVFLWYRFQRDVHLFLKFRITFTLKTFLEKS